MQPPSPSSSCSSPSLFAGDGVDFLSWFLNALHSALGGTKKKKKSEWGMRGLQAVPWPLAAQCYPNYVTP